MGQSIDSRPIGYKRSIIQSIRKNLVKGLFFAAGGYLALYSLVHNAYSFNYEIDSNSQYELAYLFVLFPLAALIRFHSTLEIQVGTFSIVILILGMLAICFSKDYTFSNEHFISIFFFFFFFGLVFQTSEKSIKFFICVLVLLYFLEIAVSLHQFSNRLELTGTFGNSGIFACYVVCGIPFLYYMLSSGLNFNGFKSDLSVSQGKGGYLIRTLVIVLYVILIVYVASILFQTRSRTALVSAAVLAIGSVFYFLNRIKSQIVWKTAIAMLILLAPVLFYAGRHLYQMKAQSASGRLLLWKITASHFWDQFSFGTGLGKLTTYYPHWQSSYLGSRIQSSGDVRSFASAGEDYLIFNEYLQLFKEVGFFGFVLFAILIFYVLSSKSSKSAELLRAAKWTVIAILICGLTSYPFHVNYFLLLLAFCLAIAFKLRENKIFPHYANVRRFAFLLKVLRPFFLLIALFALLFSAKTLVAVNLWREYPEDLDSYSKNYDVLKDDGKFLAQYGIKLSEDLTRLDESFLMLEESKRIFVSATSFEYAAAISFKLGKYETAIQNYRWLRDYVPSKFRYRYEMLKIYETTGNTTELRKTGTFILSMPIKIPSFEVNRIINDTQIILSQQSSNSRERSVISQ